MLGRRGPQRGLFEADTAYGAFVGRDSFYGWLASQRGELFRDEAFAGLYVLDNGRPSVPPSLLAVALVLQTYDGVGRRGEAAGGLRPAVEGGAGGRAGRAAVREEHAAGVSGAVDRPRGASGDLSAESGAGEAAGEAPDQDR